MANTNGTKASLSSLIDDYVDERITFDEVLEGASRVKWSVREYEENYNPYNGESWESDHDNSMIVLTAALYGGRITREEYEQIANTVGTGLEEDSTSTS